jgi:hypothetical protein
MARSTGGTGGGSAASITTAVTVVATDSAQNPARLASRATTARECSEEASKSTGLASTTLPVGVITNGEAGNALVSEKLTASSSWSDAVTTNTVVPTGLG